MRTREEEEGEEPAGQAIGKSCFKASSWAARVAVWQARLDSKWHSSLMSLEYSDLKSESGSDGNGQPAIRD